MKHRDQKLCSATFNQLRDVVSEQQTQYIVMHVLYNETIILLNLSDAPDFNQFGQRPIRLSMRRRYSEEFRRKIVKCFSVSCSVGVL